MEIDDIKFFSKVIGLIVIITCLISGGIYSITIFSNYFMNNKTCEIQLNTVKMYVPQYRINISSSGDTSNIDVYDNVWLLRKQTFVGKNFKVICQ